MLCWGPLFQFIVQRSALPLFHYTNLYKYPNTFKISETWKVTNIFNKLPTSRAKVTNIWLQVTNISSESYQHLIASHQHSAETNYKLLNRCITNSMLCSVPLHQLIVPMSSLPSFLNTNLYKNPNTFKILETWKVTDIFNKLPTSRTKVTNIW